MIRVLLVLIFLVSCKTTQQLSEDIKPFSGSIDKRYELYSSIGKYIENGWASPLLIVSNGVYNHANSISGDKLYFQGFYGIYLALNYYKLNKNLKYINEYVDSFNLMLLKTDNIYLRNNSESSIKRYINGEYSLEASKDQILGMITGLFMIHYYVNDESIRNKIESLVKPFYKELLSTGYTLYNKKAKRKYVYAPYVIQHYFGIDKAFRNICGIPQCNSNINSYLELIVFESIIYKRRLADKEIKIGDINILKIPALENKEWYKEMLAEDSFSINLNFLELLIAGTLDKNTALKAIEVLSELEVKKLKHINLAALYIYLENKWGINGSEHNYYLKVLERDNFFYPMTTYPNDLGGLNIEDTSNIYLYRPFGIDFNIDWSRRQGYASIPDIEKYSKDQIVTVDSGLNFLMRYVMVLK